MNGMTTHALWRTLAMPTHTDTRGSLTVAEADTLPFTIRRAYWLHHLADGAGRVARAYGSGPGCGGTSATSPTVRSCW